MFWLVLLSWFYLTQARKIGSFEVDIENGLLKTVTPLEPDSLNLAGVKLERIGDGAFNNVKYLKSLDLSNNISTAKSTVLA